MCKIEWSKEGLWYTHSRKDEKVYHLFRLGTTTQDNMKIYEIIIGKMRIEWS